ncbi:MAG TPA: SEL1-like repeat protein, partial [Phenylobacterium sp.]|nr:SEL1-like repeat protein [Phenylobacterium sp.]
AFGALTVGVGWGYLEYGPKGDANAPSRFTGLTGRGDAAAPATKVTVPRFAVARNPQPTDAAPALPGAAALPAPARAAAAAEANGAAELYARAAEGLRRNAPGALADLRRAANLGHAPAQFYLARIYDEGTNGVARDAEQARVWTERAARGGSRQAMHNLALNYYEGSGRTRDPGAAAQWFRRAADAGLVDSQYNLGRLYESGVGVTQNAAEAYKWYLIAARSGDGDARASASRVRDTLTPSARMAAERAAQAFRATGPEAGLTQAAAAPPPPADANDIMTAQRALSRLRYLQGPADGRASVGFAAALSAFQRDQGLPVTGRLDATTLARLAPSAN